LKGGLTLVSSIKTRIWLWLVLIVGLSGVIAVPAVSHADPHVGIQVLGLDEALTRALQEHPTVGRAQFDRDSKELVLAKRKAVYNPRLSASLKPLSLSVREQEAKVALGDSVSVNGSLSTMQGWELSAANRWQTGDKERSGLTVDASLRLWPPPKHSANYLNLLEAREAADEIAGQEAKALSEAIIDTYRRYRSLQIDGDRLQIYREEHEAKVAAYDRIVGKAQQGLASPFEVMAVQKERDESLAVFQRALRDYQRNKRSFLSDLSLEEGLWELEPLPDKLDLVDLAIPLDEAVALALEADITLRERNRALAAARRQVDVTQAANGIELSVGGTVRFQEEQDWEAAYETHIAFSYPFLDGGMRELERKEAALALKEAEKAVETRRFEVSLEVDSKLSEIQWLKDQVHIASLDHEKASLQYTAKSLQAADGLIPKSEADASQRLMMQARLDWLEQIVAYEIAGLELMSMTGQVVEMEGGYPR
jgi:outer membrane protein TolC